MKAKTAYFRFRCMRDGYDEYTKDSYWIQAEETWHNYQLAGLDKCFEEPEYYLPSYFPQVWNSHE